MYVVVLSLNGLPSDAFGPFDEDEAGAICAASIQNGADPHDLSVIPLRSASTPSATYRVERNQP
jgi:hypothetical protein